MNNKRFEFLPAYKILVDWIEVFASQMYQLRDKIECAKEYAENVASFRVSLRLLVIMDIPEKHIEGVIEKISLIQKSAVDIKFNSVDKALGDVLIVLKGRKEILEK